jgi:hypothetical protein
MLLISAAVLVIGAGIFLGVFLTRGNAQPATSGNLSRIGSAKPTDTNPYQNGTKAPPKVTPASSALSVARTFLETAVVRKNLAVAYNIVGPDLKAGTPRAEWLKGNNPVIYFPAVNANTAKLTVKSSTKNALLLSVGLKAAPGTKMPLAAKGLGFLLEVDRIHGRWLVNYFISNYHVGVPSQPQ